MKENSDLNSGNKAKLPDDKMIHRIEVGFKPGVTDALGDSVTRSVAEDLGLKADRVRTVSVYTINIDFSAEELLRLGNELFADPVIQHFSLNEPLHPHGDFDWLLEVGFRPGVTDNVGHSAAQGMQDMLGRGASSPGRVFLPAASTFFTASSRGPTWSISPPACWQTI